MRCEPAASARSATARSTDPLTRPTVGAAPTYRRPSFCSCTPTWSPGPVGVAGGGPVRELVAQVLVLQHLPELLRAPVREQELQPRLVAQPPVPVVAEHLDDGVPDVGGLVGPHERAEPLGEPRIGRQPAADPEVVTDAVLRVHHADQGDVVDLVDDVEARVPGDGGLELAREVGEVGTSDEALGDLGDRRCGVDDLVRRDAGQRRPEDHPRDVAAGLGGLQPDGLEPAPDLGHVLDPHPVQLDVLPVGDVGGVAGELGRDVGDHPQLLGGERAAVDPHAEHEVLVLELVRLELGGAAAVDAGAALGVQPPPAQPSVQVVRADRRETLTAVDVLDPLAHVQAVVLGLEHLVGVQRLLPVDLPLPVRA